MKNAILAVVLGVAAAAAHAGAPQWVLLNSQDGVDDSLDASSVRTMPDGSLGFWIRTEWNPPINNGMLASSTQHIVARCDGSPTALHDAWFARDPSGNVTENNARQITRAVVPGSILAGNIEKICANYGQRAAR